MSEIITAVIAAVISAAMAWPDHADNGPGSRGPAETEPVIMGYGRDWSALNGGRFPGTDLPPGVRICGVLGNGQGKPLDVVLTRREAFKRAKLATVEVNFPDAPVVVLLSNYHSTLWQIKTTPGTQVPAAAVSGYEPQAIMGLKPEAGVMAADSHGHKRGGQFYQRGPEQRQALVNFSRNSLGRKPDLITELDEEGRAVCGWPAPPGVELISHGDPDPGKYDAYADLTARLNKALESGAIRRARLEDLKKFKEARSLGGRLFIEEQDFDALRHAYVVESRDFVFPDELYHAGDPSPHRIFTFFIPRGLSLPEGPVEGARVLFLEDGACLGWRCGYSRALYSPSGTLRFPAPDLKLPPQCRFDGLTLPENAAIYAGGAYKGEKTGRKDAKSKHEIGQIEVTVNSPEKPAVLILAAYDPVEWRLDIKPDTTVAAVVLSGYHSQKIIDLPEGIPLVSGSYDKGRCWRFSFSRDDFRKINQVSENLFGRVPDRGFYASDGKLDIDPSRPPRETAEPGDGRPPRESDHPFIKKALAEGSIRLASKDIKIAWLKKNAEKDGIGNLVEPGDFKTADNFPAYEIVSEDFTFSKELAGTNKVNFYLPENLNLPEGDLGHADVYLLDGGICLGSAPGCRQYRY